MSGIIVPVLEKRVFEFGYLTPGGAIQDVVIQPAVDVGGWYRVRLVVLVHQIAATTGNFVFKVQHTFPSEMDRQEFVDTTDFMATASITTASPNIKTISQVDPQAYLKIILRATQGTAGNTLYGEFSAYLVLREA